MIGTLFFCHGTAMAWEEHTLPHTSVTTMTAHYGGSKAPLVLDRLHMMTAVVSDQGTEVWWSADAGVSWQVDALYAPYADRVVAISDQLVLSWGLNAVPRLHQNPSATFGGWSSMPQPWPLASWNVMSVAASASGEVWILTTVADAGKLMEGKLYLVRGNAVSGWSVPVQLSAGSVGDAALVQHSSGLWTAVWSERSATTWKVVLSNSSDGQVWSNTLDVATSIVAPQAQEAAVQIAADDLPNEQIALAFTGWEYAPHSQLWSQSVDVNTGAILSPKTLLPDAGDMVYQPSLAALGASRWVVVWQQKKEIDHEILLAYHQTNGTWSHAVNVSSDPQHVDRDPHVRLGMRHELLVAFTRRLIPDVQEAYVLSKYSFFKEGHFRRWFRQYSKQ